MKGQKMINALTREDKLSILEDSYSAQIFGMSDEELNQEYDEKIGE